MREFERRSVVRYVQKILGSRKLNQTAEDITHSALLEVLEKGISCSGNLGLVCRIARARIYDGLKGVVPRWTRERPYGAMDDPVQDWLEEVAK